MEVIILILGFGCIIFQLDRLYNYLKEWANNYILK